MSAILAERHHEKEMGVLWNLQSSLESVKASIVNLEEDMVEGFRGLSIEKVHKVLPRAAPFTEIILPDKSVTESSLFRSDQDLTSTSWMESLDPASWLTDMTQMILAYFSDYRLLILSVVTSLVLLYLLSIIVMSILYIVFGFVTGLKMRSTVLDWLLKIILATFWPFTVIPLLVWVLWRRCYPVVPPNLPDPVPTSFSGKIPFIH